MNLRIVGRFKSEESAAGALDALTRLSSSVAKDEEAGVLWDSDRISEGSARAISNTGLYSLGPEDLRQLAYAADVSLSGQVITVATEEIDIGSYIKVFLELGGHVEIFDAGAAQEESTDA